jgi:hypothetical protein
LSAPVQLASASTTDIGAQNTPFIEVTGTTTITSFGTNYNGPRFVKFAGALTLTHNATTLVLPGGANITTAAGDCLIAIPNQSGSGWAVHNYQIATSPPYVPPTFVAAEQYILEKDGDDLVLSPYGGNKLTINGVNYTIPSGGVSLAASGLTPSTRYLIYAYMNSGTMTLEASTTAHATDTNTGIEIKSGDASRTLVGQARIITGPAWQDSSSQRFVRSWANRVKPRVSAVFTADRSTSSSSLGELNSEIRNEFLLWADESVQASFSGWGDNASAASNIIKITMDGTSTELARTGSGLTSSANYSMAGPGGGTEGYHYVTVAASTTTGTFRIFGTGAAAGLLSTVIV